MQTIADFTATLPNGEEIGLADKRGKVLLVVNTASKCGFTPQYAGLEALWRKYRDRGFEVIAFPCNQFGGQEPGTADEIAQFCEVNFGLTFPLMAKIEVNGEGTNPLYAWLKAQAAGPARVEGDQVELHQVPDRPRGQGGPPLRAHRKARAARGRHRGVALARSSPAARPERAHFPQFARAAA